MNTIRYTMVIKKHLLFEDAILFKQHAVTIKFRAHDLQLMLIENVPVQATIFFYCSNNAIIKTDKVI